MNRVTRYHPLLATLHWLLALMLFGALGAGFFVLRTMSNTDPHKIDVLRWHMAGGMLILALMLIRFLVRLLTRKPALPSTGKASMDRLVPWFHYSFYALVVAIVGTGFAMGWFAHLPEIVFANSGAPLPADFSIFPTFVLHAGLALLLAVFIVVHIAGAIYHQYIAKNHLMRRIGFGARFARE
jgi:cytochrome b561